MSRNAKLLSVTGNANLLRPRFGPGQLLRDDDLNQGIDYTRDLSRLLFRSLFGCGVVCGLRVRWAFECGKLTVTVEAGVALDCRGDPIHVPQSQSISIDPSCGQKLPPKIWVVIRRTEKCCAPRAVSCSCDDEETPAVCTREQDGFEIRLVSALPECTCGCTPRKEPSKSIETAADTAPQSSKPAPKSKASLKPGASVATTEPGQTIPSAGGVNPVVPPVEDKKSCCCADPQEPCYQDHYLAKCACDCCDCEWIVLASLEEVPNAGVVTWKPDHSVRRLVRPVLICDQVALEETRLEHKTNA